MDRHDYQEMVGCIEIEDNVFIGAGTTVLYNTRIGSNVIVAAGSVITKDVPPNCVVGGVPAKVIKSIDAYVEKLGQKELYPKEFAPKGQTVSKKFEEYIWDVFLSERE